MSAEERQGRKVEEDQDKEVSPSKLSKFEVFMGDSRGSSHV